MYNIIWFLEENNKGGSGGMKQKRRREGRKDVGEWSSAASGCVTLIDPSFLWASFPQQEKSIELTL